MQGKQCLGEALAKSFNLSFTSVSSFTNMQAKLASEDEFDRVTHVLADKGNSYLKHAISYVVKVSTRIFIVQAMFLELRYLRAVYTFFYLFGSEVLEILFDTNCFSRGYVHKRRMGCMSKVQ